MAKIYNSDCTKGLAQNAAIQQSNEKVPNELAEKIVPTFETNPLLLRRSVVLVAKTYTTTQNQVALLTATSNRDLFLTGIHISNNQDAACDNGGITIRSTFDGETRNILARAKPTLTAQNFSDNVNFSTPLKIDRGATINFNLQFGAGTSTTNISLYGYYVDNINA